MFKARMQAGAVASNEPILLTPELVTNDKVVYNSGSVSIRKSGIYKITVQAVLTGITTSATLEIASNGDLLGMAEATVGATTDVVTLVIPDVERVVNIVNGTYATFDIEILGGATVESGVVIVEEVR